MPLSGNRLGPKVKAQYESDADQPYILTVDADLIVAGSGLVAGIIGATKPSRFKPRGVHIQLVDAGKIYRKFIVCGTNVAALYASNTPQVVNIDGAAFTTTGRRGEVQTFS